MIRSGIRHAARFGRPLRTAALIGTAAILLATTGCTALQEEHQNLMNRRVDVVNVVGNIWRITGSWPNTKSAKALNEYIYDRARYFCGEGDKGMMPISGSSTDGSGDAAKPATAWLEFRCANPEKVQREYKGITLHLDEFLEDEK